MNHEVILRLELSSRLRVKPKPYRCCFYVSRGIRGIGRGGGVVCGLVYHQAEVEISSQTFVTGPEKLSRPAYIPGWQCVKANQPGVSTPPASHFMISSDKCKIMLTTIQLHPDSPAKCYVIILRYHTYRITLNLS